MKKENKKPQIKSKTSNAQPQPKQKKASSSTTITTNSFLSKKKHHQIQQNNIRKQTISHNFTLNKQKTCNDSNLDSKENRQHNFLFISFNGEHNPRRKLHKNNKKQQRTQTFTLEFNHRNENHEKNKLRKNHRSRRRNHRINRQSPIFEIHSQ